MRFATLFIECQDHLVALLDSAVSCACKSANPLDPKPLSGAV